MMDATIFLREKKRAGMAGCDPPSESHGELQPSRAWQGRWNRRICVLRTEEAAELLLCLELRHLRQPFAAPDRGEGGRCWNEPPQEATQEKLLQETSAGKPICNYILRLIQYSSSQCLQERCNCLLDKLEVPLELVTASMVDTRSSVLRISPLGTCCPKR